LEISFGTLIILTTSFVQLRNLSTDRAGRKARS
jgi:hypothetical protein